MLAKIIVCPREKIKPLIAAEPNKTKVCVISISTPFGDQFNFSELLNDYLFADEKVKEFNFQNQVIHMEFDDIDHNPHGYYMPMHFRQGVQIWQFVKYWHENYLQDEQIHMYIHCDAGISRSAAIGKVISSKWNIPLESLRRPDPNKYIMREMEVAYRYLEEGLSPKEQKEKMAKDLKETFDKLDEKNTQGEYKG